MIKDLTPITSLVLIYCHLISNVGFLSPASSPARSPRRWRWKFSNSLIKSSIPHWKVAWKVGWISRYLGLLDLMIWGILLMFFKKQGNTLILLFQLTSVDDCSIDWLIDWISKICFRIDWLIDWMSQNLLPDWLIDWLIDCYVSMFFTYCTSIFFHCRPGIWKRTDLRQCMDVYSKGRWVQGLPGPRAQRDRESGQSQDCGLRRKRFQFT